MAKPHAEHSTTIKAKKRKVVDSDRVQPVTGGNVRRIVFEGKEPEREPEREVVTRSEREWSPRHRASIEDIHFEVDNLHRTRRPQRPQERRERKPRPDVHPVAVDKAIAQRMQREHEEEAPKETKPARRTKKVTTRKTTKRTTKTTASPAPREDAYQPQCLALTSGAKQCRNSAKAGSKYCGAHQGYTTSKGSKALDTKPRKGTEDTKPGEAGTQATAQCAAYTNEGLQCKHASRKTSKYCGIHKNYRAPSKMQLAARLDTKPRHKKAKDTKPST